MKAKRSTDISALGSCARWYQGTRGREIGCCSGLSDVFKTAGSESSWTYLVSVQDIHNHEQLARIWPVRAERDPPDLDGALERHGVRGSAKLCCCRREDNSKGDCVFKAADRRAEDACQCSLELGPLCLLAAFHGGYMHVAGRLSQCTIFQHIPMQAAMAVSGLHFDIRPVICNVLSALCSHTYDLW